ncbi:MAG: murein transglycosylase A [Deltaproteobacteria bacterium]|nr:murein transglycosylase A [Deltaproteobacteria bacterium]
MNNSGVTIPKACEYLLISILFINIISLFGCYPSLKREVERPEKALYQVRFFYPKFSDDMDLGSLAQAIRRNLGYLNRLDPGHIFYYGPHIFTCQQVRDSQEAFLDLILKSPDSKELNRKIKRDFQVYRAAGRVGNRSVLFTGYFEPTFEASLTPNGKFKYPLYRKPDNLIQIDLSLFNKKYKGNTITARIDGKKVLPYYSRQQIEVDKRLEGRNLEIAWLKDPVDVAFLHIQGSGRLSLPDGNMISVGYQASNGRPYRSIGRYLLDKEYMIKEEMSMQGIRKYLSGHPEIVDEVLNHNPSYVFFRVMENGPLGNISVPLTAGRSVALNSRLFPKGALCFISSEKPVIDDKGEIKDWTKFSRFVLNQDTGGAIKGTGRADLFWGRDKYAELAAGHMQHEGQLYVLIKKP